MKHYLIGLLLMAAAFTSCLSSGDGDNTYTMSGFFTIAGSNTAGYTLYQDNSGVVIPTATSVSDLTSGKGFGDYKRALFQLQFKSSMITDNDNKINGATLLACQYIPVRQILTAEAARQAGVTAADSTFAFNSVKGIWVANGYLSTYLNGYYSKIDNVSLLPATSLVIDSASVANNALTLDLYYNRHSSKDAIAAGSVDTYTSFPLGDLDESIPGSDSLAICVRYSKTDSLKVKVARYDLHSKY